MPRVPPYSGLEVCFELGQLFGRDKVGRQAGVEDVGGRFQPRSRECHVVACAEGHEVLWI